MDISLTTIITDESRSRDLIAENTSCILLKISDFKLLVNCGGTYTALQNNIAKLELDLSDTEYIIITSPLPRYYSSIKYVIKQTRRLPKIFLPECMLGERILTILRNMCGNNVVLVRDTVSLDDSIKLLRVNLSPTYSEIVLEVSDKLLIATPGVALADLPDKLLLISRCRNVVIGLPIPVISLDFNSVLTLLKRVATSSNVVLTHLTPPETKRVLSRVLGLRRLYVGDTIKICY